MNSSDAVIIGVVSSLIATFIFLLLVAVFHRVVLPWTLRLIYRGVQVQGRWRYTSPGAVPPDSHIIELNFKQFADVLEGTQTIVTHEGGEMTKAEHSITGFISDGQIVGYSRPVDKDSTNYAAFHLRFQNTLHGAELVGHMIGPGPGDVVEPFEVTFGRHG